VHRKITKHSKAGFEILNAEDAIFFEISGRFQVFNQNGKKIKRALLNNSALKALR